MPSGKPRPYKSLSVRFINIHKPRRNMPIIGFNFSKIAGERKPTAAGKVSINNNLQIKEVSETELELGDARQKGLTFTFEFSVKYEPSHGSIDLIGHVLFTEDQKKVSEIIAGWKKDKRLPAEITEGVINSILAKSNVQALILSQELNLPAPIELPKIGAK